jgi:hypothetical protein
MNSHGWPKGKKRHPMSLSHKKKLSDATRGEKCYAWKGGITSLLEAIRDTYLYRQWRSDVFTRDRFTCTLCGFKGYVEADHFPKSFANIFHSNKITSVEEALVCEEFWNINNGRTLCRPCHLKTDNYGNHKSNRM